LGVAEHHVEDSAEACPEVLIPLIAGCTKRIMVGSGGVLLRYYSPLKVAETFLTIEALFPGRIKLGVANGPGVTRAAVAEALVSGNRWELTDEASMRASRRQRPRDVIADGDGGDVPGDLGSKRGLPRRDKGIVRRLEVLGVVQVKAAAGCGCGEKHRADGVEGRTALEEASRGLFAGGLRWLFFGLSGPFNALVGTLATSSAAIPLVA
jgi:hypothetical protein